MSKRFFFLILILTTGLSCSKDDNLPAIVDIPVTFQVQMREKLGAGTGSRPLELHISSVEKLDCQNYQIDFEFSKKGRNISLALKDFILSEPCIPGEGLAKAVANLGWLNKGNYPFTISLKDVIENEGQLVVADQSYTIKLKTTDGILASPATLLRIPDNALWGEVFAASDSVATLAEGFLEELEQISGDLNLQAGNYGFFQIGENGVLMLLEPEGKEKAISFYFSYQGERDVLAGLVSEYRDAGANDLGIRLYDALGTSY
ncbi:MAG: hypothetical protein WA004_14065 [Saprospiraceae bacterium]